MSGWVEWMDEQLGPLQAGRRVLVLCRTKATVSLVRRWAARRGGVLGLEAATPAGLAQQVRQDPIFGSGRVRSAPEDVLPPSTAIGRRIGARPGLAGYARQWVQHTRSALGVGADIRAPAWLTELVDTGWGHDDDDDAVTALVEAAALRGPKLGASSSWDRVVALGFDRPRRALRPWEIVLVARLTGCAPCVPETVRRPLDAIAVPDVAAEARLAVRLAADDPDGTLILVSDTATARRVRDTLARSRLPCAWRDNEPLAIHELASAVRICAPWFAMAPDPPIQVADLAFVLVRLGLHRSVHPAAEAVRRTLLVAAGLAPEGDRLGRRAVLTVLEQSRLLDAPLSGWRRRLVALVGERAGTDPELASHVAAVVVRLELLRASLEGRPIEEVVQELVGTPVPFEADDFDEVVALLLDARPEANPAGNTLGAIRKFLVGCRIRLHDDPIARAIVGALNQRSKWPSGPSHVHQTLAGAHDTGVSSDGVDVLMVDDWDGRPCRQLVVLDVHDHGLTRRAAPDPLLTDAEIGALGAPAGRQVVEERLAQLYRAAAVAGRVVALVTRRDAGGREVLPPIQLELRFGGDPVPSYGWRLPGLPEDAALVLDSVSGFGLTADIEAPDHADPVIRHLATQATVEWYREGRGISGIRVGAPLPVRTGTTLLDQRERERPFAPAWVLPYFGHAEGVPEAGLAAGPHSSSRLFRRLAHCGYQAFTVGPLGIRDRRELTQELDPSEVGTAVHQALERVGPLARWRLAGDGTTERRQLVERLRDATRHAFDDALARFGPLSAARRASAEGRRDRWNMHWPSYVASRTSAPPPIIDPILEGHPLVTAAIDAFRRTVPAGRTLGDFTVRSFVLWAAKMSGRALQDLAPDVLLRTGCRDTLPPSCLPDLPAFAADPDLGRLRVAIGEYQRRFEAWRLPPHTSVAEVPFGTEPTEPEATFDLGRAVLKLGASEVAVSGRVDRIDLVNTARGDRYAAIVDYKTGAREDGRQFRRDQFSLKDPQLLLYAMVVERAGRGDHVPEVFRNVRAAVIAQDRVEHADTDPDRTGQRPLPPDTWMPVDASLLAWAARQLGGLVDEARSGRWTLRPRADTCPMISPFSHDRCPVASACRFRGLPVTGSEPGGGS